MSAPGGQVSAERLSENNLPQQLVRGRLLDADEGGDDLKRKAARIKHIEDRRAAGCRYEFQCRP